VGAARQVQAVRLSIHGASSRLLSRRSDEYGHGAARSLTVTRSSETESDRAPAASAAEAMGPRPWRLPGISRASDCKAPSTIRGAASVIRKHMLPAFGARRLEDITEQEVDRRSRPVGSDRPLSDATTRKVIVTSHGVTARGGVVPASERSSRLPSGSTGSGSAVGSG
jgi:integrase-like protein